LNRAIENTQAPTYEESELKVGYLTVPGGQRETNEDSFYVDDGLGLFILADGMGGHNAGEVASKIAVEVTAEFVRTGLQAGKEAEVVFREALASANRSIFEKASGNPAWSDMGTTLLMALATDHKVVIGHVGDSRAYLIGKGKIEQITEDHTFVFQWLKEGLITKEEARTHSARHGLTEVLGVSDEVEVDVGAWPWEKEVCLLLCSDGLTDVLRDEEILSIAEFGSDPQQVCDTLVDSARQNGAGDDITVIFACHGSGSE
jgi:PPM family protein phosphatase